MNTSEVTAPEIYVDAVIFQLIDNELSVLLTQRERNPFSGKWALPGGIDSMRETTLSTIKRWIVDKTGIHINRLGFMEQLYTFDTIIGNPQGPAISVVYMGVGRGITPKATALSRNSQFFPVDKLPDLAFDHNDVIDYAVKRLRSKLSYTNAVFALLPAMFTLSQLQTAYEAVLNRNLDKRNFRKKFLKLSLVHATKELHMDGAHRPARLYKFNKQTLEYLSRSFD
jgi:8-oxo-dGTP diphosphatase